jgi:beta-N-acetylhexosaminidase
MIRRAISIILVAMAMLSLLAPILNAKAQGSPEEEARALLTRMTPEERVGQLFLVSFQGTDIGPDSKIYDLIVRHHIGGVILSADNNNFVAPPTTIAEAYRLVEGLQEVEWNNSLEIQSADSTNVQKGAHTYIPLFVGIQQPGDGLPNDQILYGMSSVAPEMAIGATWDPTAAEQTGLILGSELSVLGFNLYFGPSLDVLTSPMPSKQGDPGTLVFGGDPFWVGKLGQSYIEGLHKGSDGRIAVIARNFPGRGEADRPPEEEVSTVRKSLEQLKQIELAPFFAVTGNAPSPDMTADGLLVSHIRYQGFQGNIRATTRPVSFDSQALGQIMNLEPFGTWRQSGGIIVSDSLGTRAVSHFYAPTGQNFSALIVARDSFLAGSDLLNMGGIVSTGDKDNYETVVNTLDFFSQKYREDSTFVQRVDESVLRLLTLKFKMYNTFSLPSIIPPAGVESIGLSGQETITIARQSGTLLSPNSSDLSIVLPDPPAYRDRMVFITDNRKGRQCSTCPDQPYLPIDALMTTVLRLYGPQGGDQIVGSRLSAYTLDDLADILPGGKGNPDLENYLRLANWVVFSTLDLDKNEPHAQILNHFLSERVDLLREKHIVLFSFGAPYYLDATDISKLTAFYGLYGKSQPFVDTAARLLFKEINPNGQLPVSVPGIGYDLINTTTPAPGQLIQLYLNLPPAPTPEAGSTPEPTLVPLFSKGNSISVRTGIIIDNNGNPVPDGTVVTFTETVEGGLIQQLQAETIGGMAAASFRLDRPGLVEIKAASEPAVTSVVLQIDVTPGQAAAVTVIAPTPIVTVVNTPLPEPTATQAQEGDVEFTANGFPLLPSWLLAMVMLIFSAGMVFYGFSQTRSTQWALRWTVSAVLGGLAAYNYAALGLPGSKSLIEVNGFAAILIMMLIGMGLGLLGVWLWERYSKRAQKGR